MNELRLHPFKNGENDQDSVETSTEDALNDIDRFRQQFPGHYIKFRTFGHSSDILTNLDTEGRVQVMAHARDLWRELGDPEGKYKIPMPRVDYIIGHEPPYQLEPAYNLHRPDARPGYYSISEEIIGTPLTEEACRIDSLVTDEELDDLFATLSGYYLDKLHQGGDFVVDMKMDQFMYGYLKDDLNTVQIFLVDQEPFYGNAVDDGVSSSGGFESLRAQAYKVAEMVIDTEAGRETILPDARRLALQLLNELPLHPAPLVRNDGTIYDPTEKLIAELQ